MKYLRGITVQAGLNSPPYCLCRQFHVSKMIIHMCQNLHTLTIPVTHKPNSLAMVIIRHSQHFGKVRERSWSWFKHFHAVQELGISFPE